MRLCPFAALAAVIMLRAGPALALPAAPSALCAHSPDIPACRTGVPACTLCHTTPPARNAYGAQLAANLLPGTPRPLAPAAFLDGLGAALDAVRDQDADGDGASNLEELRAGTLPGDPTSVPSSGRCPDPGEQLGWNPCAPDLGYTLRRLTLSFCGRSPTRDERQGLAAAPDPDAYLGARLDQCLDSEHWLGRDGVVWNLANRKIKPQRSLKAGEGAGEAPFSDYLDDYNLFVSTQLDNHDARDLLTASYHVARDDGPPTTYASYSRDPGEDVTERGFLIGQKVPFERRAGMLTTGWFLTSNTMFTALPRTTAAQACRAYLGFDIARLEGLAPVANEPADHDARGVKAPECATCHSTLDPLTYPFAFYSGLGGEDSFVSPGSYIPGRPSKFVSSVGAGMAEVPEAGVLFGQPVADLVAWSRVAASSESFARATVLDYWRLLFGDDPSPSQQADFDRLWRDFMGPHQYGVERMLHALIQTEAYRVP